MKTVFLSALLALTPALVLAAPAAAAAKSGTSAKVATTAKAKVAQSTASKAKTTKATAAKVVAAKHSQKIVVAKAASTSTSNHHGMAAAAAIGAGGLGVAALAASAPAVAATGAAESSGILALADRVHTGIIACELGASVRVNRDPQSPGHFNVDGKGFKYHMTPVATSTGSVRLEDSKAGAVWLQIGNKSMLMDQKRGQRLADECMSPEQHLVAQAIKKNPPPSVLDAQPAAIR